MLDILDNQGTSNAPLEFRRKSTDLAISWAYQLLAYLPLNSDQGFLAQASGMTLLVPF